MDRSFCQLCGSPIQGEFCVDCGAHRALPRDLYQAYSTKPAMSGGVSLRPYARLLIALVALPVIAIGIGRVALRSGAEVSVDQTAAIADERSPEASAEANDRFDVESSGREQATRGRHKHGRSARQAWSRHRASRKLADSSMKQESSM